MIMMLKKQTVWLLTMLSLLIVLSVYYMTSPGGDQMALVTDVDDNEETENTNEDGIETNVDGEVTEGTDDGTLESGINSDEMFTQLRMELQDKRSRQLEQYEDIMASSSYSSEEKSQAFDAMNQLEEMKLKEGILEKVIQTEFGYSDVLVRAEEDVVHVTVKANDMSPTETVNIMQMVRDEFGDIEANVKFQPTEEE
jgi:stage III sporulation protein AH